MLTEMKAANCVTRAYYELAYWYPNSRGCGYMFPCSEGGEVDENFLAAHPLAAANYKACQTGVVHGRPICAAGIQRLVDRFAEPAEGQCPCGTTVVLQAFTNTCEGCGREYDNAGQELAPREQWDEGTRDTV